MIAQGGNVLKNQSAFINGKKVSGIAARGKSIYPSAEPDYITANGTQYINTGINTGLDVKLECRLRINGAIPTATGEINISGAIYGANAGWITVGAYSTGGLGAYFSSGARAGASIPYDNKWHFYHVENGLQKIDSITANSYTSTILTTLPLHLFKGNLGFGGSVHLHQQSISDCKIWVNNVLVRDFVPVHLRSLKYSNIPAPANCLWDKVTQHYFINQGSGDFVFTGEIGTAAPDFVNLIGNKISDWESGQYDANGNKAAIASRIRLNALWPIPSRTLYFNTGAVRDTLRFVIRVLDSNKVVIQNLSEIPNGYIADLPQNAAYLAVTIHETNNTALTYANFQTLLASQDLIPWISFGKPGQPYPVSLI